MKYASTAMHVHRSPAKLVRSSSFVSNTPRERRPSRASTRSAKPESSAEATKIGASMAVCHASRATSRPKIQAVTECTRMATGKAKRDTTATLEGSALLEVMKYRYTRLITR